MNVLPPSVKAYLSENGGSIVAGALLLVLVGNALRQTGAFEVYVNGTKVYSKIETGAVPSLEQIREAILKASILRHEAD